jgi:hypothetical protein
MGIEQLLAAKQRQPHYSRSLGHALLKPLTRPRPRLDEDKRRLAQNNYASESGGSYGQIRNSPRHRWLIEDAYGYDRTLRVFGT